jgi:glycosyltransferase involved in cell wall biosynthesis
MRKKKVLHIITRMIIGGAQENTMYSVEGLIERGWHADLLTGPTTGPEGEIVTQIKEKKIPLYEEPTLVRNLNPIKDITAFFRLYKFIKKGKYDIVHTHSSKAGIIGRWASFLACVPVVHTIHGLPFHRYQPTLVRYLYVFSEWITAYVSKKIISVSSNLIEKCLKRGIGRKEQYLVIRSGLNINDFLNASGNGKSIRKQFNIGDNKIIFGTLARLFYLKGHKYIINIASDIVKKHPGVIFMFIGDGILKEEFQQKIRKFEMENHFVFVGLIQPAQVPNYLDACDVIIHPSLREGLPRVVPQAFLLEKPVVAFNVDGTSEVVIPQKTGFLIPPKNERLLKKSINYVINNMDCAKKMAVTGKKKILKEFSIDKMVSDIDHLYKRLLNNG